MKREGNCFQAAVRLQDRMAKHGKDALVVQATVETGPRYPGLALMVRVRRHRLQQLEQRPAEERRDLLARARGRGRCPRRRMVVEPVERFHLRRDVRDVSRYTAQGVAQHMARLRRVGTAQRSQTVKLHHRPTTRERSSATASGTAQGRTWRGTPLGHMALGPAPRRQRRGVGPVPVHRRHPRGGRRAVRVGGGSEAISGVPRPADVDNRHGRRSSKTRTRRDCDPKCVTQRTADRRDSGSPNGI